MQNVNSLVSALAVAQFAMFAEIAVETQTGRIFDADFKRVSARR
jgi:hypothetical protein